MTTANRPTWHARVGTTSSLSSSQVSSKDLNGFTTMKYRQVGQSSKEEMAIKDLKTELAMKEETFLIKNNDSNYHSNNDSNTNKKDMPRLLTYKPIINNDIINKYDDADADANDDKNSDNDLESSDDDDDDDDEDDEMELLRELERIKAERALAQEKKEREEHEEAERKSRER
jgi:protein CWC15